MQVNPKSLVQFIYLAITLTAAPFVAAKAMTVEPMVIEIASMGKDAANSFRVTNTGAAPLPVEITVSRLEVSADGTPSYMPAPSDILIYPPQANIQKGAAQTFRVQWIGDPALAKSQTYRLSVSQVPLKMAQGQSGIQITMSFGVVVSVAPPQAKAAIAVLDARSAKGGDGKSAVALSIKNSGNKQAYMRDAALSLSAGNWSKKLSSIEVGQRLGLGIIQPGKERRFLLPVEVPGNVSKITASIDYQPEK